MSDYKPSLGDRIKERRIDRGLTQVDAADVCGVRGSTYNQWELDRSIPRPAQMPAVAKFLGVKLTDLPDLVGETARRQSEATVADLIRSQRRGSK